MISECPFNIDNEDYIFSSELKGLNNLVQHAEQFTPGYYMIISNQLNDNGGLLSIKENYHNIIIYKGFKMPYSVDYRWKKSVRIGSMWIV